MRKLALLIGLAALVAGPASAQNASNVPITVTYFGFGESTLTREARGPLVRFALDFIATGQTAVQIAGHTDRAEDDDALAQRRAEVVRDYLVALRVPASAMTVQSYGELRPAIDTPDGTREPDNRRVEVMVGAGSGW